MSPVNDSAENSSLREFGSGRSAAVKRQLSEPTSNLYSTKETVPKRSSIKSAVDGMKKGTADFFCVGDDKDNLEKWTLRRKRLLNRKCGKLKECDEFGEVSLRTNDVTDGHTVTNDFPSAPRDLDDEEPVTKPAVLKLTWDGLAYVTSTLKQRLSSSRKRREELGLQKVYTDSVANKQDTEENLESMDYFGAQVRNDQLKAFIAQSEDEKAKKLAANLDELDKSKEVE